MYFAYIKFYVDGVKKYDLVAGKSGSYNVNKSSGCDLGFYLFPQKGPEQKIENILDAFAFVKPMFDRLTEELMTQIQITNTDLMLRKLFVLYEDTYAFYCKDRKTRTELANKL